MNAQTPIAAEAIIAQITSRGDCDGQFYAEINGREHEFTAWFSREIDGPFSDERPGEYYEADCKLIGAWAFDDDDGVAFAGNRSELAQLLGERIVTAWEAKQSETETEGL